MAIPPLPPAGSTDWYDHYAALDTAARVAATGGGTQYDLPLSSFSGADDDAKLSAFMSYAMQQDYRGLTVVLDEARQYNFTQKQPLYSGFSIRGSGRPADQLRSGSPTSNKVRIRTDGGWFYLNQGQTFSCAFQGLSIDGNSSTRLLDGHSSNVLWTSVFRDCTSVNAANVLGSESNRLLVTACLVDGFWNVNNSQGPAFTFGGSDFYFNPTMMLLDTNDGLGASDYIFRSDYLSNSYIENIYMTNEGHRGFLLSGGTGARSNWIKDCVIEGRNPTHESPGALIVCTGGKHMLRDNRYAFAMGSSSDGGVIQVDGGRLSVLGGEYQPSVAESVPFIRVNGGHCRVRDIEIGDDFSGKPVVSAASASLVDADDSVTVVTD